MKYLTVILFLSALTTLMGSIRADGDSNAKAALALAQAVPHTDTSHIAIACPVEGVYCDCGCIGGGTCTCAVKNKKSPVSCIVCDKPDCSCGCGGDPTQCGCNDTIYRASFAIAVHRKLPIIVFVHQKLARVDDGVSCRWDSYPCNCKGQCVVIGIPDGNGGMNEVYCLGGSPDTATITRAVKDASTVEFRPKVYATSPQVQYQQPVQHFQPQFMRPQFAQSSFRGFSGGGGGGRSGGC